MLRQSSNFMCGPLGVRETRLKVMRKLTGRALRLERRTRAPSQERGSYTDGTPSQQSGQGLQSDKETKPQREGELGVQGGCRPGLQGTGQRLE